MASDLERLAQLLNASLDPRQNKLAELQIRQQEVKPGFSLSLLRVVASTNYGDTARLAGALYFKNFIRRNWTDEEGNHKLPQNEVTAIKQELIGLMISMSPSIQYQLGDAVGVIADSDFWQGWDTLVDDLVSRLSPNNPSTNNGVLQVAHSIFKRWRPLYRSDDLFTEINHVLGKFGPAFLPLCTQTDNAIDQCASDKPRLREYFSSLNLIMKLLYDLSVQDLPPVFEDNMPVLVPLLHKYLIYDNPLLHTDRGDDAGPLELVKSSIFEVLGLYVQKYEDAFGDYIERFVASSWSLLTTIGLETKYDILVSKALQFLTSVTRIPHHARSFNNEGIMGQVVENVILPNLNLREADIELFEDEPIEYIRRDLEGSDSDTRRRAATDFLRQLIAQYEQMVTEVTFEYINHYLADYAQDTKANWKSKDTAVYLYSSIAAKGTVTASQGVKSTNQYVNILEFFQQHIASDFASDLFSTTVTEAILRVDAIKFLYTFRSQMTRDHWQQAFPLLVQHLSSSDYVVYSYAAIAVERVLALTDDAHQPLINQASVIALSKQLLEHLFQLIEKDSVPEKVQENEFLMRCVMRVLIVVREGVTDNADSVLAHLIRITQIISRNPSNPRFYYYHFEALGAFIRFAAPSQHAKLESGLLPTFGSILQEDIQEFMPYIFQLFAALLEAESSTSLSVYYKGLISPLLTPDLWISRGNVPALTRLMTSIIPRGAADIVANRQLEPVLAVFQSLVVTKVNETHAFELLECIMTNIPASALSKYYVIIMQLLLTRLQNSKTEAFNLKFVRFYHFVSAKDDMGLGADVFIDITEQVQASVFVQLYLSIILPDTQKLARPLDRKTAVISLTKTLADSVAFAEKYAKGWAYTCEALLKLLENPPVPAATDDLIIDQDVDDMSFGVGYTQLTTIRKPIRDQWPEVMNVKTWVGEYLKAADRRHQGRISEYVQQRLSTEAKQTLTMYLMRGL